MLLEAQFYPKFSKGAAVGDEPLWFDITPFLLLKGNNGKKHFFSGDFFTRIPTKEQMTTKKVFVSREKYVNVQRALRLKTFFYSFLAKNHQKMVQNKKKF